MFKILIILILIGYVFHKITSFVFRGMFRGSANRDQFGQKHYSQSSRRTGNSDVNIDRIPKRRGKKEDGFTGGEYVDYEEVK
ncbi:MAG: DUF4834 family protein [Ekhidna sp.]